ncbi:hypothetical protein [Chitinophaga cymbidii]|uniref:Uncharacterized protein n=1 Tax=Chitinophaga cymbidii TaxID=1096750 RepID=A0A512RKN5_9BACT|nr:hypothetical protein [Chitinophaga cymbidii]GEP96263.1 hypothetical protein CCY01nite_25230 [Chitinophaga cymbidii]
MYYLKCNHCGHTNALKSEYVTFCASCSKKMANSYADWKQRNPEGNFASYCEAVGVTENEPGKPVKRKRFYWDTRKVVIAVVAVLISAAGGLAVEKWVKGNFGVGKVPEAWLTSEWRAFSTPRGIGEIATPTALHPFELPPSAQMEYLEFIEPYRSDSTILLQIAMTEFECKPGVEPSLEGAAAGAINEMRKNVRDFDYEEVNLEVSGEKAIRQTGKYRQMLLSNVLFRNLLILKGQRLVQVLVIYPARDKTAEEVAERIINSVKLKNI